MFGIPLKYIIIGAIALVIFYAGWNYKATLAALEKVKDALTTANATIGAQDEVLVRKDEIVENERKATDEIESAPQSDDGPVAPVLRRAIDGLR